MSQGQVSLLGLDFPDWGARAAAAWLAARPAGARFNYVVTPNADHFVRLHRQPALQPLYRQALLRLLDSRVVRGTARVIGLDAPSVCTGSDLAARILLHALRPGERIVIIGLRAEWVAALSRECGIVPAAHCDPPLGFDEDPDALRSVVEFVAAHPARFVFLAVGSPRQERLAAAIAASGRAIGTGLCVGAALEFLAGARRRAPAWMQAYGLEWLHRLASEPCRLASRYLRDSPHVFLLLARERRRLRSFWSRG